MLLLGATLSAASVSLPSSVRGSFRNWEVFHAFVPMRSNFGAELYEATIFSQRRDFPWMATLPLAETAPEVSAATSASSANSRCSRQQGEIAKAKSTLTPASSPRTPYAASTSSGSALPASVRPRTSSSARILAEAVRRIQLFASSSFAGLPWPCPSPCAAKFPARGCSCGAFLIVPFIYYFVTVQARFAITAGAHHLPSCLSIYSSPRRPHPHLVITENLSRNPGCPDRRRRRGIVGLYGQLDRPQRRCPIHNSFTVVGRYRFCGISNVSACGTCFHARPAAYPALCIRLHQRALRREPSRSRHSKFTAVSQLNRAHMLVPPEPHRRRRRIYRAAPRLERDHTDSRSPVPRPAPASARPPKLLMRTARICDTCSSADASLPVSRNDAVNIGNVCVNAIFTTSIRYAR